MTNPKLLLRYIEVLEQENDDLRRRLSKALGDLCSALDLASYRQLMLALNAPDALKEKPGAHDDHGHDS